MERDGRNFLSFWPFFALLPTNNLENQNFEKMKKKTSGDITILHMCNINDGSYDVWFLRYGVFFHFGSFYLFYSTSNPKIKILKNEKSAWRYHHFTKVYHK